MSQLNVDTIKKADGTGSITVPADTGTLLTSASDLSGVTGAGGLFESYAVIADVKAYNAQGGTATSGDYRTRDLNTEVTDPDGIVTLSSNQFTLGAGSYYIRWRCPAYKCGGHTTLLRNITDSSNSEIGTSEYTDTAQNVQTLSEGSTRISFASSKTFEIWHRVGVTKTTNGFGVSANDGGSTLNSVYTIVEIFKEA